MRFLVSTGDAFGTVNPMIGLAKMLKSREHQIVFVSNESFRQLIENCGFIYEAKIENSSEASSPKAIAEYTESIGLLAVKSSLESMKICINSKLIANLINQNRKTEENVIKKCIKKYNPDIIITNSLLGSAESVYSGIPWIGIYCESPLNIYNSDLLPPYMSGYATNSDPKEWQEFKILHKQHEDLMRNEINAYYREYGFPEINTSFAISPYLNLYGYPQELDYTDIVPLPPKWFRVDSYQCIQNTDNTFKLPEKFEKSSLGKLIYVSMGTIGSINLDLMEKLLLILSKSPHNFIVSKGPLSSELKLHSNMWGESYLPQTEILPKVDLFITHGGNNSMAEGFYFGKPMIIMPLFFDQYDNAQRIHETGFGVRIDAKQFTETELLTAIETLLSNKELTAKLETARQRIQSSKSLEQAVKLIENLKSY